MFTANYLYNVIETVLWTVAMGIVMLIGAILYMESRDIKNFERLRLFLIMITITGLVFDIQLILDHIPL
jgi:hypothetical protein